MAFNIFSFKILLNMYMYLRVFIKSTCMILINSAFREKSFKQDESIVKFEVNCVCFFFSLLIIEKKYDKILKLLIKEHEEK